MLSQFDLRVRFPHNIDKILSNKFNYKTGTFYCLESEEYEKRIKRCYDVISEDLKVELVDLVKISLPILKAEISSNKRNLKNKNERTDYVKYYLLAFIETKYKFFSKWVKQKSKEYLNNREIIKDKSLRITDKEKFDINLSDTKDINKVRFLIELGIVDYLKDNVFEHSNNAVASALSGVTGIKRETLQSYINAYLTETGKNNPAKNTKEMNKIRQTLNQLGFNQSNSNELGKTSK
jgi:hypothetical protein